MPLTKKASPQEHDYVFPQSPADSVSSIVPNGSSNMDTTLLFATSWDNAVTCYEIKQQPNQQSMSSLGQPNHSQHSNYTAIMQSQIKHDAPVLCCDICKTDNYTVFSGSADGAVKMWTATQGPNAVQQIGKHEQGVKGVKYIEDKKLVVTGCVQSIIY